MRLSESLSSPIRRISFYTAAISREIIPAQFWQLRKNNMFSSLLTNGLDEISRMRINYYNKLSPGTLIEGAPSLADVPRVKSYYYYDLRRDLRAFDHSLHIHSLFGDINYVPKVPSVLKSRPIGDSNSNSVILKLNRFRHFSFYQDPICFENKRPHAVWRGVVHNNMRRNLVEFYGDREDHNIGHIGGRFAAGPSKPRISIYEQMKYRYIVSVEGNDVATNTKWIMNSNSVCLMPKPAFETWFMEGKLEPFVHYVPVSKDFSDLDEKIAWCEDNLQDVHQIIANAKAYVRGFSDHLNETLLSLLVLQKYFERTGQIDPAPFSRDLFD